MEKTIKYFNPTDFTDKRGNVWYQVDFESGETAKWGTKKDLIIGMKIDCDLVEAFDKNGNSYFKVKLAQKEGFQKGGGSGYKLEPFEHKAATMSTGYVKDLIVSGKLGLDESSFNKWFDIFYNKITSKKQS